MQDRGEDRPKGGSFRGERFVCPSKSIVVVLLAAADPFAVEPEQGRRGDSSVRFRDLKKALRGESMETNEPAVVGRLVNPETPLAEADISSSLQSGETDGELYA
jgi:hypothetical protein